MRQLGLDIGGSGIKAAIVDTENGEFLTERYKINTPQPADPERIGDAVQEIVEHFQWKDKVGCCFPTIVKEGECFSASNISKKWIGKKVDEFFSQRCGGLPFYVGNDADLAGIAEMRLGAGKNLQKKVVMITIGTGLGAALFYNGKLIPNIELGHMQHKDGKPIEFYAANSARKRENLEIDEWAKRFDFFIDVMYRVISPQHIILGGGISKRFDEYKDLLSSPAPIHQAHFRNRAGIIGAAMFATEHK